MCVCVCVRTEDVHDEVADQQDVGDGASGVIQAPFRRACGSGQDPQSEEDCLNHERDHAQD